MSVTSLKPNACFSCHHTYVLAQYFSNTFSTVSETFAPFRNLPWEKFHCFGFRILQKVNSKLFWKFHWGNFPENRIATILLSSLSWSVSTRFSLSESLSQYLFPGILRGDLSWFVFLYFIFFELLSIVCVSALTERASFG